MNENELKMMSQSCPDSKSISNQINNFLLNQLYLLYQRSTTESKGTELAFNTKSMLEICEFLMNKTEKEQKDND